jgi:hypothetical protein
VWSGVVVIKVKTFITALKLLSSDPVKAKSFLQDKRLSQNEKIILRCYFLLRDNELDEVVSQLKQISSCTDTIVEAQKQLLLGLTANNQSHFKEAFAYINTALKLLKNKELPYFEYIGLYNQFIISFNQKDREQMRSILGKLKKLPLEKEADQIMILRCFLNYYTLHDQFNEAHHMIEEIEQISGTLTESDGISFLIDKINLAVKEEKFDQCQKILSEMKKFRKFHLTENYNFIKLLLDNITHDTPLYFNQDLFVRIPVLHYQMKTIRALEEGNEGEAKESWAKLTELYPELYEENFKYRGDKSLFSLALNKHVAKIRPTPLQFSGDSSQHEKILTLLQNAKAPINRDLIYHAIYGKPAECKDDYLRLSKVISRLKKKTSLEIGYKKACYFLVKTKQAA